jgi:hypothetical protein
MRTTDTHEVRDGDRVLPEQIPDALTAESFVYTDGATQVFTADGHTTFIEHGTSTEGEWGVDADGRFWSFWPPSYRAVYDLTWMVDSVGKAAGVRFADVQHGRSSEGRYATSDGV